MISKFFLVLRSYDSVLEKERGRFQGLVRAESQIHLVCEIRQETPPHQNLYSSFFGGQSLPCLVYAHCFNNDSFYEKK